MKVRCVEIPELTNCSKAWSRSEYSHASLTDRNFFLVLIFYLPGSYTFKSETERGPERPCRINSQGSYRRRLRSLLLYLCYVFRALINSLGCYFVWICLFFVVFCLFVVVCCCCFVCLFVVVVVVWGNDFFNGD